MRQVENNSKEMEQGEIYLHAEMNHAEAVKFYKSMEFREEQIQMRKSLQRGT